MLDAISSRRSVRAYTGTLIPDGSLRKLEAALAGVSAQYPDIRLTLEQKKPGDEKLGTYGMIKDAPAFLVMLCRNEKETLLRAGAAMEKAVILCTALGLGTCWLGGSFNRKQFSERVSAAPALVIPAVVAVGVPAEKDGLLRGVVRRVAGSDNRRSWEDLFFADGFKTPLKRQDDPISVALEMVRLAPSASNKQPWRVIRQGGVVHFYLAHAQGYEKMPIDMQLLDMGIAMAHFEMVMQEREQDGEWTRSDPALIAPHRTEYISSWTSGAVTPAPAPEPRSVVEEAAAEDPLVAEEDPKTHEDKIPDDGAEG